MKLAFMNIQKAIYDRLKNNLTYEIYDSVPHGAKFPYIVLGESTNIDFSTKVEKGHEITYTIHIWSEYEGYKELNEMASNVLRVITDEDLIIDGFHMVMTAIDMVENMRDPEGYRHCVIRLRFKIQE